jgi:hypothetical protein
MSNDRLGILYIIIRICLAILTLLAIISIIINIIQWIDHNNGDKLGGIIWSIVCLIISFLGFYGAWREHFMATLVYAITVTILLLAGIAVGGMELYTRITQIFAVIVAIIYCWLLHAGGKADYSMPRFRK